jgi:hypothetical protein
MEQTPRRHNSTIMTYADETASVLAYYASLYHHYIYRIGGLIEPPSVTNTASMTPLHADGN